MEDLINQSLNLDVELSHEKDRSARIRDFLKENSGRAVPNELMESSSPSEWFNETLTFPEDAEGKIIVLDFFTYCCINCIHAFSVLEALESRYSKEQVVFVGIHCAKFLNEKSRENVSHAIKRYGILHPVLNDEAGNLWNAFSITCWPTIVIIDTSFRVRKYFIGENYLGGIELFLKVLLEPLSPRTVFTRQSVLAPSHSLHYPGKLHIFNNRLCLSDSGNNRILLLENQEVIFIVGDGIKGFKDGTLSEARFSSPQGVVFYDEDSVYVADTGNHALRLVDLKAGKVSTIAGTGKHGFDLSGGKEVCQDLVSPWDLCIGRGPRHNDEILYIAMAGSHQIWGYSFKESSWWKGLIHKENTCFVVAGNGREENRNNLYPHQAAFAQPSGICYSPDSEALFIADSESSSIRRLSLKDGSVKNVCGGERDPMNLFAYGDVDGVGVNAKLQHPLGITTFTNGRLLVADSYNHKVKIIDNVDGKFSSCSGFGSSIIKDLQEPSDVHYDSKNDCIYICDSNNHRVLRYSNDINELTVVKLPIQKAISKPSIEVFYKTAYLSDRKINIRLVCQDNKRIQDIRSNENSVFHNLSVNSEEEGRFILINGELSSDTDKGQIDVCFTVIYCDPISKSCQMKMYECFIDVFLREELNKQESEIIFEV